MREFFEGIAALVRQRFVPRPRNKREMRQEPLPLILVTSLHNKERDADARVQYIEQEILVIDIIDIAVIR